MDREKLVDMKKKLEGELSDIQRRLNEVTSVLNQLQVMLIDRRGKLEIINEMLKEYDNK